MAQLSSDDKTTLEKLNYKIRRYLHIAPRTAIFQAQVNGTPPQDTKTKGYYQVTFDNVTLGSVGVIEAGMTLDFGTTPGARDVGSVRVRSATGSTIKIAETAPGSLNGLADNIYITVINEFRMCSVAPRLVAIRNSAGLITGFTYYIDYDTAYSNQNLEIPPIVNVYAAPAGPVDSGQTYRTVAITIKTIVLATGRTPSNPTIDVKDGTITVGPTHSTSGNTRTTTLTVRFPQSTYLRYIKITGNQSAGGATAVRRFPIFVRGTTQPITKFSVTRDDSPVGGGRTMNFELFGTAVNEYTDANLPEHTFVCYEEVCTFGGTATPAQYRSFYLGWAIERGTLLKVRNRGRIRLNTAGPAYWMEKLRGWALKISDATTPASWMQLDTITGDRITHMWLRMFSTFLTLFNLEMSGLTREAEAEDFKKSSLWGQIKWVNEGYANTQASCDTLGNLWLRQHYQTMTGAERLTRDITLNIDPDNLFDESGLEITDNYEPKIGLIVGRGSSYDGSVSKQYKYIAPGRTPGQNTSEQEAPYQRLPTTDAADTMRFFLSDYYGMLTNPRQGIATELLHNLDVIEPAWCEPVRYNWLEDQISNVEIDTTRMIVTKVSIRHSNQRGQLPKRIVLTVDQLTSGKGSQPDFPVVNNTPTSSNTDTSTPQTNWSSGLTVTAPTQMGAGLIYGNGALAFFDQLRTLRRTANFYTHSSAGGPSFDNVSLTAIGMGGAENVLQFVVDASSFGTGLLAGWIATTTKIWKISAIFGTPSLVQQLAPGTSSECNIDFDWTHPADVGKFGVYIRVGSGSHLEVYVTTDGAAWTLIKTFGGSMPNGTPALWIDPHEAGVAWMFAKDTGDAETYLYKMEGYGSFFTKDATIYDHTRSGQGAVMPYLDSSSTRIFHDSWLSGTGPRLMRSTVGGGMTHIPLTYDGTDYGPRNGRWGMSIANGNRNKLLVMVTSSSGKPGAAIVHNPDTSPTVQWISPPSTINYTKGVLLDNNGDQAILMGEDTDFWLGYWDGNTIDSRTGNLTGNPDFIGVVANG